MKLVVWKNPLVDQSFIIFFNFTVMTLFFLGCTELSPGFPAVGYKNLSGILGLSESLGM